MDDRTFLEEITPKTRGQWVMLVLCGLVAVGLFCALIFAPMATCSLHISSDKTVTSTTAGR
jgi:hypothetical protein